MAPESAADALWTKNPIPNLDWSPFVPTAAAVTIPIAFAIVLGIVLAYYFQARKLDPETAPSGYVLVIEMIVAAFENATIELLGERYRKMTPYFLVLILYMSVSNLMPLIGLTAPTSSLTVTFTFAFITFLGLLYFGFRHQKLAFLNTFLIRIKCKNVMVPVMINPLNVISEITPMLSMSMRLAGNIFAGSMVIGLFYSFMQYVGTLITDTVIVGLVLGSALGGLVTPIFHLYFDVVIGLIQAYVFVMLTYTYWQNRLADGAKRQKS